MISVFFRGKNQCKDNFIVDVNYIAQCSLIILFCIVNHLIDKAFVPGKEGILI